MPDPHEIATLGQLRDIMGSLTRRGYIDKDLEDQYAEKIWVDVVNPLLAKVITQQVDPIGNGNELLRLRRLEQWLLQQGAPTNTEEMIDWLRALLRDLRNYRVDRQHAANLGTTIQKVIDRYADLCPACRQGYTDVTGLGKPPHSEHVPGPDIADPPADVPPPTGKFLDGYH